MVQLSDTVQDIDKKIATVGDKLNNIVASQHQLCEIHKKYRLASSTIYYWELTSCQLDRIQAGSDPGPAGLSHSEHRVRWRPDLPGGSRQVRSRQEIGWKFSKHFSRFEELKEWFKEFCLKELKDYEY